MITITDNGAYFTITGIEPKSGITHDIDKGDIARFSSSGGSFVIWVKSGTAENTAKKFGLPLGSTTYVDEDGKAWVYETI